MNKHLFKLFVLWITGIFSLCASTAMARPRVAVMPFKNPPGFDQSCPIGTGLADMVRKRLMDTGKVIIVSREDMTKMKEELNLSEDSFFDPSTFPEKGGFQGADYLLTGKILDFGHFSKDTGIGTLGIIAGGFQHKKTTAYVRLSVEVIDLKNGRLTFSQNYEARQERSGALILAGDIQKMIGGLIKLGSSEFDNSMIGKATNKALDQVIPRLSSLFTLAAKVLAVSPTGVVIDMGTSSGLKVGQKARLFSVQEIKNSQGKVVWQSKKLLGDITITEVQPDGALGSTPVADAKEGDLVVFEP